MAEALCFIPARGGSKRFKRKNMAKLRDRPLLSYPVEAAKASKVFDRIVLSSEDPEILAFGRDLGIEVDNRPKEFAGDSVTVARTLQDFLRRDSGNEAIVCCLYPTAVLVDPNDLSAAYASFRDSSANSMLAVARFNVHPWEALYATGDGSLKPYFEKLFYKTSHDFPELVADTGTFSFVRRAMFLAHPDFSRPPLHPFQISELAFLDINFPEDLKNAEILLRARESLKP